MNRIIFFLFLTLFSFFSHGETIADVEQDENIAKAEDMLNRMKALSDEISNEKKYECIKSFGHKPFCDCIVSKLPVNVNFKLYIAITTSGKEKVGYSKLKREDKERVDYTLGARNQCVSDLAF